MFTVLWVALGGAVGSLARYGISGAINENFHPWGTVAVNLTGSLALGVLVGVWGFTSDGPARVGMTAGLLGGFTTFSTFSVDVVRLWEDGSAATAVGVVAVSVAGGILTAILGVAAGRALG